MRSSPSPRSTDGTPEERLPYLDLRGTLPGLSESLEIPIVAGSRLDRFVSGDRFVAVVNETAAPQMWPDGDAVGRPFSIPNGPDGAEQTYRVVGVAADARMSGADLRDGLLAYVPFATLLLTRALVVIETAAGAALPRERIEAALSAVDPGVPLEDYDTLRSLIGESVRLPRFQASLMSALGGLSLFMAVAGCYAVPQAGRPGDEGPSRQRAAKGLRASDLPERL